MRKTIRNGINRRALYHFICNGPCGKKKATLVYQRAADNMCLSCSKSKVDPNQQELFIGWDLGQGESITVIQDNRPKEIVKFGRNKSVEIIQEIKFSSDGKPLDIRVTGPNGEIIRDFNNEAVKATVADIGDENVVNSSVKERHGSW